MRFLTQKDYERLITVDDLNQVFDNGSDVLYTVQQRILDSEPQAQEEIESYLKQRYDISQIFTDTSIFDIGVTYYGNNRVQYHEPSFSATTIYTTSDLVSENGGIYTSIGGSAAHAFNPTEWTFICLDYQLFYVTLPFPSFDYSVKYAIGQQVWYQNNIYTSKYDNNIVAPTDTTQWTFNSTYSLVGVLPTDGTKWTLGDNRSSMLVQKMVDIVLYHAHATINQRSIPILRITRYSGADRGSTDGAIQWLNKIAKGELSANLPVLPPAVEELALRWSNSGGDSQTNDVLPTPKMSY